jgi:hypothetical protein
LPDRNYYLKIISNKKHALLNSVCANVLWSLWKVRNDLIFNGQPWMDTKKGVEENSWIAQKMEVDLQGQHDGQCELSLSGDHLDLAGSDAAGKRLKASRSTSLPSSPA